MMDLVTMIFYLGSCVIVLISKPGLSDKEYEDVVVNKKVHDLAYLVVQRPNIPVDTVDHLDGIASLCLYQFFLV